MAISTRNIKTFVRDGGDVESFPLSLAAVLQAIDDSGQAPQLPAPIGAVMDWEQVTVEYTVGGNPRADLRVYMLSESGVTYYTNNTGQYWALLDRPNWTPHEARYTRDEKAPSGRQGRREVDSIPVGTLPQGMTWEPTADPVANPAGEIKPQVWGAGTDNPSGTTGGAVEGSAGLFGGDVVQWGKDNPLLAVAGALVAYKMLKK